MATAPYPFPYPSAATYPHQIHHHHPFPFGFPSAYAPVPPGPVFFQPPPAQTATTASPYAATYRYPPPASAYTHAPAPTTSSFPCSQAPPSTPPTGAPSLSASPETTRPRHAYQVPSCPLPSSPNRERIPLQNGLAMEPYANEGLNNTPAASGASTAPTVFGFTTATPLFSNTTASSSSPLTAATTTKVASTPSMFSTTSAATSSSKSYLSYPFGPSCSAPTQACDSVSVMHPSAVPSTMAGVAPKVFGEMPTPISWQGTHGTAPDYCLGHHNLSPSSCASNISEQNLDGKPQPYGFHNLNRHSVLLADGTKRSYYALPENYSLERATSSTPPAIPTVEVSDTYQSFIPPLNDQISEKQTHPGIGIGEMMAQIQEKLKTISENLSRDLKRMESQESKQSAATQASGLAPVCCSKTHNTVGSETMPQSYLLEHATSEPLFSNDPVDVSASTLEQQPDEEEQHADVQDCTIKLQQKDDESTCSCPVRKASNSSAKTSSKLSIVHGMSELRMLWDPGASTFLYSSKAKPPRELSYVAVGFPKGLNLCHQVGTYVQHLRDLSWNLLVTHERQKEWDPGDTTLQVMFTTAVDATKWQCTEVYKSAIVQTLDVNFSAGRAPIFKYAIICTDALGLRCKEVNASALFVLAIQGSTGRSVAKPLSFLANDGNSSTHHSSPMLFMQLLCANTTIQVTEPRYHLEFSLLFAFLKYMPQRTSMGSSEWISHVVIVLSCRFPSFEMAKLQWDPGIGIQSSLYLWMQGLTAGIATEKSLSWLPIPQLTKWQSKVASASFEWDPGTMLLMYKFKWWLLYTEENTNWNKNIKCYGVALWLIHFQPP